MKIVTTLVLIALICVLNADYSNAKNVANLSCFYCHYDSNDLNATAMGDEECMADNLDQANPKLIYTNNKKKFAYCVAYLGYEHGILMSVDRRGVNNLPTLPTGGGLIGRRKKRDTYQFEIVVQSCQDSDYCNSSVLMKGSLTILITSIFMLLTCKI